MDLKLWIMVLPLMKGKKKTGRKKGRQDDGFNLRRNLDKPSVPSCQAPPTSKNTHWGVVPHNYKPIIFVSVHSLASNLPLVFHDSPVCTFTSTTSEASTCAFFFPAPIPFPVLFQHLSSFLWWDSASHCRSTQVLVPTLSPPLMMPTHGLEHQIFSLAYSMSSSQQYSLLESGLCLPFLLFHRKCTRVKYKISNQ